MKFKTLVNDKKKKIKHVKFINMVFYINKFLIVNLKNYVCI